ncbi:glycosyltransferase family 2 protein [Candidatus Woesearchaeota archaeon]|nr:glycosyltransferase family 2 protein [Candidatus Woesearchaeota archaeon]
MKKLVSVVIPAKDEEASIGMVLKDLNNVIKKDGKYEYEVIVIDDKSKDRTGEIAVKNNARVIRNPGLGGKGKALALGFKHAKGDYIVMLDADYSHRPEEIPNFLKKLEQGYGLVVGSRHFGGSEEYTLIRLVGNVVLTFAFRMFFGMILSDALNGFKAFKKNIVKNYEYSSKDFEIEIELIANALREREKVGEILSHERARFGGRMKSFAPVHGTKFLLKIISEGVKLRFGM